MNLSLETSVSFFTVFFQGLLSFFSPCVLPLVPLYIGYLAGGMQTVGEDNTIIYPRKKIWINTLFFLLGISFAFFLLGMSFTALGQFFGKNRLLFARISGVLMIFFGLYQLGIFGRSAVVDKERRLPFSLERWNMNPLTALVLGFTFSFAWTPCVGPALASVLLMISSSASILSGMFLIGVYILGFVLPFLAVGFFTSSVLNLFKKYQHIVRYTVKIGGILLVFMGIITFTGWMNGLTSYLSSYTASGEKTEAETSKEKEEVIEAKPKEEEPKESPRNEESPIPAPDYGTILNEQGEALSFTDQYGVEQKISDYKGKTIFLNFWATWCGPCQIEMPDIQKLYEEYGENEGDLIVLGVANPKTEDAPYNADVSREEIEKFLEENGYTYPVMMDTEGIMFQLYNVSAFPTTFMIDTDGNIYGYVTGTLTAPMIESIVTQTMESAARREEKTQEGN